MVSPEDGEKGSFRDKSPSAQWPALSKARARIARSLPELNFIVFHYIYFIATILLTALIFWGSSTPFGSVSFTDSLFLTASAMTEAGLNTVNLSTLNTWQQVILFLLILVGSAIFVSIFIVLIRVRIFESAFKEVIQKQKQSRPHRQWWPHHHHSGRRVTSTWPQGQDRLPDPEQLLSPMQQSEFQARTNIEHQPNGASTTLMTGDNTGSTSTDAATNHGELQERNFAPHAKFREQQHPLHASVVNPYYYNASSSQSLTHRHTLSVSSATQSEGVRHNFFAFTGVGASAHASWRPMSNSGLRHSTRPDSSDQISTIQPRSESQPVPHGHALRNSQFHGLTGEERADLGGREYFAILFLSVLVPFYFFIWQFLGTIALGAWVNNYRPSVARENGLNPWWVGAFNAVSAFNNSGMSLLDANMVAFQDSVFMLLSMGLFILAGNTAYPIFLRLAIWSLWKLMPQNEKWQADRDTLRFLLDHPRRCYTNLFPQKHTWWLALALIVLNGLDWSMFEVLNIGNKAITELSPGYEVVDGLFQALAVRSGGFYVVPIPSLRIAVQVLYVLMMYISAYPITISMRNSNVYEERSLGIFAEDLDRLSDAPGPTSPDAILKGAQGLRKPAVRRALTHAASATTRETRSYFVRQQLRAQLAHDAWWIAVAVFLIMIIEAGQFEADPAHFSVFNVIFEVVSGYGCVGISTGVPNDAYSFCGSWHVLSKLILIAVMIRGRHRGLPVALDHAVHLNPLQAAVTEEEDGRMKRQWAATRARDNE